MHIAACGFVNDVTYFNNYVSTAIFNHANFTVQVSVFKQLN